MLPFLTLFYADFGKEFPSRTFWRHPSWNCPSPSSVLGLLLYWIEHFSGGEKRRKGAEKGEEEGWPAKGGKKEKRTRENRSDSFETKSTGREGVVVSKLWRRRLVRPTRHKTPIPARIFAVKYATARGHLKSLVTQTQCKDLSLMICLSWFLACGHQAESDSIQQFHSFSGVFWQTVKEYTLSRRTAPVSACCL